MNRSTLLLLITSLALLLSACGTPATPAPATSASADSGPEAVTATPAPANSVAERPSLNITYADALSPRLLLSLGTLKLAETASPITPEQAPQLLILWQALTNLTNSGTGATEEVNALLLQIEQTLSADQIDAINAMQLTQVEMQTWAQANGTTTGTGGGSGGGQGSGGLSAEARATRQAENGKTGSTGGNENGLSAAIANALIAYLQSIP
jgi:hypothetical protein